ncbi:hypothetical protein SAMN06295879_1015 [Agreia bicolorata]|uniref:Uncharacterized protein n=1 Tax=Agreia bicolorata TaxID=110935 RepID=A0A1T4XC44_9MICO|nr:hypothetical protein SAMN06295879_1015 [Agreia bicolorata]
MNSGASPSASRQHERDGQKESVETLTRRAHSNMEAGGIKFSSATVSRLIRDYLRKSRTASIPDFDAWFMPHVDPTGETAVHNLMRGSR